MKEAGPAAGSVRPALPAMPLAILAGESPPARRGDRLLDLFFLCALAFGLCAYCMIEWPNTVFADENYQVLEQAHRLVFGTGIAAWEFTYHIRSWVFPGLVAGLMALGGAISHDPGVILLPVRLFMLAASLAPVICGYLWGEALLGRRAALVTGFVAAVWVDLLHMAPHTLNEVLAADLLTVALYLGWTAQLRRREGGAAGGRLFWSGFLLGLVFVLRFQQAPALALAGACFGGWGRGAARRWGRVLLGAAVPVLLCDGLLDTLTLGTPFQSVWYNIYLNMAAHVSDEFGVSPFSAYAVTILKLWGLAALPMVALLVYGARLLPLLLRVALVIIFFHSFIPHKEMRFIYPAYPLMTILVGLGISRLLARYDFRLAATGRLSRFRQRGTAAIALLAFASVSLATGTARAYRESWLFLSGYIRAMTRLAQEPGLCGVALDAVFPDRVPGNNVLPPEVPVYGTWPWTIRKESSAFNAVITDGAAAEPGDPAFRRLGCYPSGPLPHRPEGTAVCIWKRPGPCAGTAPPPDIVLPKALGGKVIPQAAYDE